MKRQFNLRWVSRVAGPVLAFRYSRAAQRDENNGFPLTAAMEWRIAAELSSSIALLANHYWREWERIVHLPRRLAAPIGVAHGYAYAALQPGSVSRAELAPRTIRTQVLQPAA
jgi:hypothetical protein